MQQLPKRTLKKGVQKDVKIIYGENVLYLELEGLKVKASVEEALGNNEEASADPFYNFVSDSILPYAKAEPAYIWEISRKYADALETVTQLGLLEIRDASGVEHVAVDVDSVRLPVKFDLRRSQKVVSNGDEGFFIHGEFPLR